MPTLLQINTTLNVGSTGRIAEQISDLAQIRGWNCYIAHGARYVNKSRHKSIQIGTKLGNIIHAVLGEYLGAHGFGSAIATYLFIRKVMRIKPDIIHLHNVHGYYLNIRLLFSFLAKANVPIVWTLHDCWTFTGHCTHFESKGCYKWKETCGECPQLMTQYKSRILDCSRKNLLIKKFLYDELSKLTITPVSQWLGSLVAQSILQKHTIKVIHNGIDISIFKPLKTNIREILNVNINKKIILGVVSSGFKGKIEFIRLSSNPKYQIVIVGVKKEWMDGIPSNIICVSHTNNQSELAEYYSAADVFVNPTYDDSLGLVNIESLACGTPVVTYRSGGSPETIDEHTGISVDRGDFVALNMAIDIVLAKGKETYSKHCRQRAEMFFNKDDRFKDYIDLYEKLLVDTYK